MRPYRHVNLKSAHLLIFRQPKCAACQYSEKHLTTALVFCRSRSASVPANFLGQKSRDDRFEQGRRDFQRTQKKARFEHLFLPLITRFCVDIDFLLSGGQEHKKSADNGCGRNPSNGLLLK